MPGSNNFGDYIVDSLYQEGKWSQCIFYKKELSTSQK